MKFKAINEIENFDFRDAVVHRFSTEDREIVIELEAVIVNANNSQNSNFTRSYAGDLRMSLHGATLQKAIREGYKYYNADNVLLEEVPDTPLSEDEIKGILRTIDGAYLWAVVAVNAEENTTGHYLYQIGIDRDEEITYWFQIEFDECVMEWDRYMNRVQDQ